MIMAYFGAVKFNPEESARQAGVRSARAGRGYDENPYTSQCDKALRAAWGAGHNEFRVQKSVAA